MSEIRYLLVTKYSEKISFQLDPFSGEDTEVTFSSRIHSICGCFVDVKPVFSSHYVLKCRGCGLRVVIPNEVNTYKKLKKYFRVLRKKEGEDCSSCKGTGKWYSTRDGTMQSNNPVYDG